MLQGKSVTYVLGTLVKLRITNRAYVTWPRAQQGQGAVWRSGALQRRAARAARMAAMYIRAVIRRCDHRKRRERSYRRTEDPWK